VSGNVKTSLERFRLFQESGDEVEVESFIYVTDRDVTVERLYATVEYSYDDFKEYLSTFNEPILIDDWKYMWSLDKYKGHTPVSPEDYFSGIDERYGTSIAAHFAPKALVQEILEQAPTALAEETPEPVTVLGAPHPGCDQFGRALPREEPLPIAPWNPVSGYKVLAPSEPKEGKPGGTAYARLRREAAELRAIVINGYKPGAVEKDTFSTTPLPVPGYVPRTGITTDDQRSVSSGGGRGAYENIGNRGDWFEDRSDPKPDPFEPP